MKKTHSFMCGDFLKSLGREGGKPRGLNGALRLLNSAPVHSPYVLLLSNTDHLHAMSPAQSQHLNSRLRTSSASSFENPVFPSSSLFLATSLPVRNLQRTGGSKGALEGQASRSWVPLGNASHPVSFSGIRLPRGFSFPSK